MLVLSGAGSVHFLVPGCDYIMGRKTDSDIQVTDTNCGISRHHGLISYHINGELLYTDKSQYGSFIDSKKIDGGQKLALKVGSEIKLGHHPTIWKIEQMKVAVSNLQGSDKREVVSTVKKLKIEFSGGWDKSCTTLIMSKISSTVKVIKAVAHCRLIRTPAFIKDLEIAIKNRTKISEQNAHIPSVDSTLRTAKFSPMATRKTLFEHLQFVFMSPEDKKESEELVKDLGGTVALLDSLYPDRRKIILSQDSIVMDTKDAALSDYIKSTLLERDLAPTKSNDIILALLYNDKSRLFKKPTDTQSTQSAQVRIQDTQAFSQMTCTLQETQSLVDRSCDESKIEASAVPPRLDKTIPFPSQLTQRNSHKVESCASTIKPEIYTESDDVSKVEPDNKPSIPLERKPNDISYYEASAVPPKLDKTIKTPSFASPHTSKQDVSFIEPSAIPPRLDLTTKSPLNSVMSTAKSSKSPALNSSNLRTSSDNSKQDVSFIEPSAIPPRLDLTTKSPLNSMMNTSKSSNSPASNSSNVGNSSDRDREKSPAPVTLHSSNVSSERLDLATPSRTSVGSSVSLFDNSRSTSFIGASTPSATMSSKTPVASSRCRKRSMMDSDSDEEDFNPWAKTKSTLLNTNFTPKSANSFISIAKKPKTGLGEKSEGNSPCQSSESGDNSALSNETTDPESCGRVCESPTPSSSQFNPSPVNHQISGSQFDRQDEIPTTSQSFKRELQEKTESATKKLKTDGSHVVAITTSLANVTIPDTSHSVWLKRLDTKHESSLEITEIAVSSELIQVKCNDNTTTHVNGTDKNVVNFKRFKKKGVIVRSMDATLSEGNFRSNTTSNLPHNFLFASQSQQSVYDEDEEPSLFADKFGGGRRTLF